MLLKLIRWLLGFGAASAHAHQVGTLKEGYIRALAETLTKLDAEEEALRSVLLLVGQEQTLVSVTQAHIKEQLDRLV